MDEMRESFLWSGEGKQDPTQDLGTSSPRRGGPGCFGKCTAKFEAGCRQAQMSML